MRLLRQLVSTNKRRHKDSKLGVDLDLSYIVDGRIVAMGFPSCGLRSILRNPIHEVQRFFQHHAKTQHWRVYNLCIEPGWQYKHHLLPVAAVIEVPLWDAQAPPLSLTHHFCEDAAGWLAAHPHNCIAVHCKAGKGRTGALISALLIHLVHYHPQLIPQLTASLLELCSQEIRMTVPGAPVLPMNLVMPALGYWAHKRTIDGKGLTICSQRRYVSYYAHMLQHGLTEPCEQPIHLWRLVISGLSTKMNAPCLNLGLGINQTTAGETDQAFECQEQALQTHGSIWKVPALTVAVWVRPPDHTTATLLAYGWTGIRGLINGQKSDPTVVSSDLQVAQPTNYKQVAGKVVYPTPISIDNQGNLCMQLSNRDLPADNSKRFQTVPNLSHSASDNMLAASIPSRGSSNSSCQTTAERHSLADDNKAADPTNQATAFKSITGDIKVQVLRGHCISNHPAVFTNRTSVFYTWLNTAFLAMHDQHVPHSRRPGFASKHQPRQTKQQHVSDLKMSTNQHGAAVVSKQGDEHAPSSFSAVALRVDELDKVDKRLRHLHNVSLQLEYSRPVH